MARYASPPQETFCGVLQVRSVTLIGRKQREVHLVTYLSVSKCYALGRLKTASLALTFQKYVCLHSCRGVRGQSGPCGWLHPRQ